MKNKLIIVIVGILVIALIIWGVSTPTKSNVIKIGVMSPLSGQYAVAGDNFVKGITLAHDLYVGKHPDKQIDLIVEDDGFIVGKGTSAFKKLTSVDKANALITVSTPVIDALYKEMNAVGIPIMQLGIQTVGLGPDNIYQTSPAAGDGIVAMARYINEKYSFSNIAIVYDNTPGGTVFYNYLKETYVGKNDNFIVNTKDDLRPLANKISASKYDAVVMLNSPENGAILTKEMMRLGPVPQLVYDAQLQTGFSDYKRILGDTKSIDGALSMWFKDGDREVFTAEFKKKYSTDPGFLADFGYDTFNVLINAYSPDKVKWLSNIAKTETVGASGKFKFDSDGVRKQDISINQVKGGEIVPIYVMGVE